MQPSLAAPDAIQHVVLSVLPVIVFLCGLCLLDSYRLVRPASVSGSVVIGALVALGAAALVRALVTRTGLTQAVYSRAAGPVLEESLKFCCLAVLVASRRIGFMVDAAIHGFALGAGFAVVENLLYLSALDAPLAISALRGFGTAVMHGGTAAIAGIVAMRFAEERGPESRTGLAAGFLSAVAMHTGYNTAAAYPAAAALGSAVIVPVAIVSFFRQSERTLRRWLGVGLDTDAELLEMIRDGKMYDSRIGAYLSSLKDRFPAEVVADMFCLLRVRIELSIRAKGVLLMQRSGFVPPRDPELPEKFRELDHLTKAIGSAGMLAMLPLLSWRRRDLWEMNMLAARRER